MRKRLILAIALLFITFPAYSAECMSGLCGNYSSKDDGSFTVGASILIWNKSEFQRCYVVAQDPKVSILKCTRVRNTNTNRVKEMIVYFYLRKVNKQSIQITYANELPEDCIAKPNCWPNHSMFFHRLKKPAPAAAPETAQ